MRVFLIVFLCFSFVFIKGKQLKKVLILSRHNVRTPLSVHLDQVTPKKWPEWKEKSGYLTAKGALLESYMGAYFSSWLRKEDLLPDQCPSEKDFFVYANFKQRTVASAKAFVSKAFPNCSINIHYGNTTDSIFIPFIHNSSEIFRRLGIQDMKKRLKSLHINGSYEELDEILDYRNSNYCKTSHKCDLITDKNKVILKYGDKPNVIGPLKIGNSVIDAFIMGYYEGFSDVAWGQLNDENWHKIMPISRGFHSVIFNTKLIAKDIATPLVKYISDILLSENTPKATLLMGHDANLYTLLDSLAFKSYSLPYQYEVTPVGAKIVFQKWYDEELRKYQLKINYVYQTSEQLRNGIPLNLTNPPMFYVLEMDKCKIDSEGFCLWDDFVNILQSF